MVNDRAVFWVVNDVHWNELSTEWKDVEVCLIRLVLLQNLRGRGKEGGSDVRGGREEESGRVGGREGGEGGREGGMEGVREGWKQGREEGGRDLWDDGFLLPPPAVLDNRHAVLGSLLSERVWSASLRVIRNSEHRHYIVALLLQ